MRILASSGWFGMRLAALAALAAIVALQPTPALAQQDGGRPPMTVNDFSVVLLRAKAVADARSQSTLGQRREGSGIVIDTTGLVLTIGYLIQEAEQVEVVTADGKPMPAAVVAYDFNTGFGLVRTVQPLKVKPIDFGESQGVADREPVLIVGWDGVAPAFVVSKRPFAGYWEYLLDEAIFTAPATVNWQGAALIDRAGKLLGVGSLVVGDAMGSSAQVPGNMFVPIDLLKPILGDMLANGKVSGTPRPWIGVTTQELQGKLLVTRVSPDSPAEAAGLATGDIILGIRGQPVAGQADFYRKLWASGEAGTRIELDVLKGTAVSKMSVRSVARDTYLRPRPYY